MCPLPNFYQLSTFANIKSIYPKDKRILTWVCIVTPLPTKSCDDLVGESNITLTPSWQWRNWTHPKDEIMWYRPLLPGQTAIYRVRLMRSLVALQPVRLGYCCKKIPTAPVVSSLCVMDESRCSGNPSKQDKQLGFFVLIESNLPFAFLHDRVAKKSSIQSSLMKCFALGDAIRWKRRVV